MPGEANQCICCSGSLPQAEARVYLLANHSGGAQWRSWTVAAFALSFLFHVCLSEMAKPFRGLTVLHLRFEVFLFFILFSSTDKKMIYSDLGCEQLAGSFLVLNTYMIHCILSFFCHFVNSSFHFFFIALN